MDDLISRKAAIDAVESAMYGFNIGCLAVGALEDLPSAETKRGKWIPVEKYGLHKCSVCKYEYRIEPVESFKFCPNCGARMGG